MERVGAATIGAYITSFSCSVFSSLRTRFESGLTLSVIVGISVYIIHLTLYKYDISVGFPPGITSRERIVARGCSPRATILCFIIPIKIQNTKGETLQTPVILDKYSSSALLN